MEGWAVKSNINMLDRYVRLASGLVLMGCALSMKRRSVVARSALLGFGAMKVAEGATGWCPLVYLAENLPMGNDETSQRSGSRSESNAVSHDTGPSQGNATRSQPMDAQKSDKHADATSRPTVHSGMDEQPHNEDGQRQNNNHAAHHHHHDSTPTVQ